MQPGARCWWSLVVVVLVALDLLVFLAADGAHELFLRRWIRLGFPLVLLCHLEVDGGGVVGLRAV